MRLRNTIIILLVLFSQFLLCSCASTKDMRTEGDRYIEEKEPPSSVSEIAPVSITKKEPRKQAVTPYLQISTPEIETITVTHKYVMGDNDSKNDARRMCFLEAKRKALEKAGIYIENRFSHIVSEKSDGTAVKGIQLAKDELYTYAAALLKVDIVKEEWKFIGENMAILMIIQAEVDMSHIQIQLSRIKQDTSIQKKMKDQQARLQELERKITKLQKQLLSADQSVAISLRKQRITVFGEINIIQARHAYVLNLLKDKRAASVEQAKLILNYIEIDMTPKEVEYVLGKPDKIRRDAYPSYMAYGRFRIYFSRSSLVDRISFNPRGASVIIIKDRAFNILIHGIGSKFKNKKRGSNGWCYGNEGCRLELKQYVLGGF